MWENTEARRQTLLLALLFSPFNIDINIVRVAPFLLELPTLLPEVAFIETFPFGPVPGEIGVQSAPNLLDLDYRALHRFFVAKRKLFHTAQERDDMIHTLIQQEQAFV